ncbi:putative phage tail protein [Pantoea stewartii]
MKFSVSEYLSALWGLMPTGKIWRRDASSTQTAVLTGIANAFYESGSEAYGLIAGSFPATATTMLSEWESTMALPDDCTIGETYSTSARQLAVSTKLATAGGQSVAHFTTAAKALGYDITITEYRPARAGFPAAGPASTGTTGDGFESDRAGHDDHMGARGRGLRQRPHRFMGEQAARMPPERYVPVTHHSPVHL